MAPSRRTAEDIVDAEGRLKNDPADIDFFAAVRWLAASRSHWPRVGLAQVIADDGIRFSQKPSLQFEPSAVSAIEDLDEGRVRLEATFFGMFGINGALPEHVTALALEPGQRRQRVLATFLDVFHQRLFALYYRAWEVSDLAASHDREDDLQPFKVYIGSLFGLGSPDRWNRDDLADAFKLYFAGWLANGRKSAEGLEVMAGQLTGQPCRVEPFQGEWLQIPVDQQWRLGDPLRLGEDIVLGARQFSRQGRIELVAGPMTLASYRSLLPGSNAVRQLQALVRSYLGDELRVSLRPVLKAEEIPPLKLGSDCRLGWDTWICTGHDRARADGRDLQFDVSLPCTARE
jgi:type VI secretion system protein ImpH